MENKILKTIELFEKIEHLKSQEVAYWAESSGQLVDHIMG